jgi:hypothetical protein
VREKFEKCQNFPEFVRNFHFSFHFFIRLPNNGAKVLAFDNEKGYALISGGAPTVCAEAAYHFSFHKPPTANPNFDFLQKHSFYWEVEPC